MCYYTSLLKISYIITLMTYYQYHCNIESKTVRLKKVALLMVERTTLSIKQRTGIIFSHCSEEFWKIDIPNYCIKSISISFIDKV